jgi:hypothetical protein
MDQDEASLLLDLGALQASMSPHVARTTTRYVLRRRIELPKVVGDDAPPPPIALLDGSAGIEFMEILTALRLLRSDAVGMPGFVSRQSSIGGQMISYQPMVFGPRINTSTLRLDETAGRDLVNLWSQLKDPTVRRRGFIGTAVRRIGYASERERVEDRFLDLLMAAEALLMGDQEPGGTTGELTYKISMRFGHYAVIPGTSRRQRFQLMRDAYGARSAIVHGGSPKGIADVDAFTAQMGEHVRSMTRASMRSPIRTLRSHCSAAGAAGCSDRLMPATRRPLGDARVSRRRAAARSRRRA